MCIAIVVPAGKVLPPDHIANAFNGNRDGGGFAYVDNGKVVIRKGFFNLDDFMLAFEPIAATFGKDNPMLVHFRIATTGKVNMQNCHPYQIDKGRGALIHNGSFSWARGGRTAEKSDTKELVEGICNNMNYEDAMEAYDKINTVLGWNKVATLHANGKYIIFNNKAWTEKDGIFYSTQQAFYKRNW